MSDPSVVLAVCRAIDVMCGDGSFSFWMSVHSSVDLLDDDTLVRAGDYSPEQIVTNLSNGSDH